MCDHSQLVILFSSLEIALAVLCRGILTVDRRGSAVLSARTVRRNAIDQTDVGASDSAVGGRKAQHASMYSASIVGPSRHRLLK